MTAQIPDTLVMDGERFDVLGFIGDPPGIDPPPKDPYVTNTACWSGYTCRWEVKNVAGEKRLFLLGYP